MTEKYAERWKILVGDSESRYHSCYSMSSGKQ